MASSWHDLGVDLLAGFIGFGCGAVLTYFFMGRFLDRRSLIFLEPAVVSVFVFGVAV